MRDVRINLTIIGEWADLWLYKDTLFLWTAVGDILHLSTDRVVSAVRREYGDDIALATQFAFFRNDWRFGSQMKALKKSDHYRTAHAGLQQRALEVGSVTVDAGLFDRLEAEKLPGLVLSTSIYANHAYVGTSEGLFETNLNPRYLNRRTAVADRLHVPVHSVCANYGAVAAAAFEDGLWTDVVDLSRSGAWQDGGPLKRSSDFSSGVAMASRDLLSFNEDSAPELLLADAEHAMQSSTSKYPSWQVRSWKRSETQLGEMLVRLIRNSAASHTSPDSDLDVPAIRVIGNANQVLLIETPEELKTVRLRTAKGVQLDRAHSLTHSKSSFGSITASSQLRRGFVIESTRGVHLVDGQGVELLSDSEALAVRSFPNSTHFSDTLAVVHEESAELIGFV